MTEVDVRYSFRVSNKAADAFVVRRFTAREALSELYSVDLVLEAKSTESLADCVGEQGVFTIGLGDTERRFWGVVSRLHEQGVRDVESRGIVQVTARLVPRAWLLKRRRDSRIFQNLRVSEVISEVLAAAGIPCRWRLGHGYPRRDYCTQYEETDYEFVRRLMGEHGLYCYFVQGADGSTAETLVFGDDAAFYPNLEEDLGALLESLPGAVLGPLGSDEGVLDVVSAPTRLAVAAPVLAFRPNAGGLQPSDGAASVSAIEVAHRIVPRKAAYRVHDPRRPNAPIEVHAEDRDAQEGELRRGASGAAYELEVYEHHGQYLFPESRYEVGEATRILRAERRHRAAARGRSGCFRLEIARCFTLGEHPLGHLNREFAVVEVRHAGHAHGTATASEPAYSNEFRCVPSNVTYVPARPKLRRVQACLTATVVGPVGEEVFANEFAQIKVQFHWDRGGKLDDTSSCWVRCMQSWAGSGWGVQYLPRVGNEVVVGFEGGDLDRPIVLGSVYNAVNPTPFSLPEERTRSGVRTRTTPRGERGNELSFEDARGHEQIRVVAERDLDTSVRHDRTSTVGRNDRTRVEGDLSLEVLGQSHLDLRGAQQVALAGALAIDARSDVSVRVRGSERREIDGDSVAMARGDVSQVVRGNYSLSVGNESAARSFLVRVDGTSTMTSEKTMRLRAEESIELVCGNSLLSITPERIELSSPEVLLLAEGATLSLKGKEARIYAESTAAVVAGTATLSGSGAQVTVDSAALVEGSSVRLKSGSGADGQIDSQSEPPTTIELRDDQGRPLAYQRYRVTLGDGSQRSGILDKDGKATLDVNESGEVEFPGLFDVDPA